MEYYQLPNLPHSIFITANFISDEERQTLETNQIPYLLFTKEKVQLLAQFVKEDPENRILKNQMIKNDSVASFWAYSFLIDFLEMVETQTVLDLFENEFDSVVMSLHKLKSFSFAGTWLSKFETNFNQRGLKEDLENVKKSVVIVKRIKEDLKQKLSPPNELKLKLAVEEAFINEVEKRKKELDHFHNFVV